MPLQDAGVAQQLPTRPAKECRVYERRPCALPASCQPASVSEMNEARWPASISDISQGGVLIVLPRRFEKGTGLALELPGDATRESSIVFVKVVHLSQRAGAWALGCKFVSPLSEDELQRLLTSTNPVLSSAKEPLLDEEEPADTI
jgi:PilZ domain